jgi:hypothetical protein
LNLYGLAPVIDGPQVIETETISPGDSGYTKAYTDGEKVVFNTYAIPGTTDHSRTWYWIADVHRDHPAFADDLEREYRSTSTTNSSFDETMLHELIHKYTQLNAVKTAAGKKTGATVAESLYMGLVKGLERMMPAWAKPFAEHFAPEYWRRAIEGLTVVKTRELHDGKDVLQVGQEGRVPRKTYDFFGIDAAHALLDRGYRSGFQLVRRYAEMGQEVMDDYAATALQYMTGQKCAGCGAYTPALALSSAPVCYRK